MVHWDILLTAVAASLPALVGAIAVYFQGHSTHEAVKVVKEQTNGLQTALGARVTAVEDVQAKAKPVGVPPP